MTRRANGFLPNWFLLLAVVFVAGFFANTVLGGTSDVRVLDVQGLRLLNESGEVRAVLGLAEDGNPGLVLLNNLGRPQANFRIDGQNSAVLLYDYEGKPRASISVMGKTGAIVLWDSTGKVSHKLL